MQERSTQNNIQRTTRLGLVCLPNRGLVSHISFHLCPQFGITTCNLPTLMWFGSCLPWRSARSVRLGALCLTTLRWDAAAGLSWRRGVTNERSRLGSGDRLVIPHDGVYLHQPATSLGVGTDRVFSIGSASVFLACATKADEGCCWQPVVSVCRIETREM